MKKKNRAVILGGAGFIGSHVAGELAQHDWEVCTIDRKKSFPGNSKDIRHHVIDLPDPSFGDILRQLRPGAMVFAAGSALVRQSLDDPYVDFSESTSVYFWALDQLRRYSPDTCVVFLSSAAVYGNPASLPADTAAL